VKSGRQGEWLVTLPSFGWLIVFFLIPTLVIFAFAFKPADPFGGVGGGWTSTTIAAIVDPQYASIVWRTVWISLLTTVICLVLATPAGYAIARSAPKARARLLLLVIVPFWTSFLIRIFAWKVLLHPEGGLKLGLVRLGVLNEQTTLLYTAGAVLLVMVYTFLPFAILPIYAAAEKFDFRLLEAAQDLGATRLRAFFEIFLPGIRRGLVTAFLVVFIPALGSYVIPDLVGGPNGEMLGNKIAQRVFVDRNLPLASALSLLLILAVVLPMAAVLVIQARQRQGATSTEEDA
jgi:spermidine/putrescine transport system permease protein